MIDSELVIDKYIKKVSKLKWDLVNRSTSGIQVRKIKQVKMIGVWVGLLLIPFWGIGFILWLFVLFDYALQRERVIFVSVNEMIKQLKKAA